MTHDYKRNGTTTLFAALNILDGTVIGQNMQRHRHQEFIRFLNAIERKVPVGKVVHVILDNYAAHKHPAVRAWLARHPRWTFHFTPTSASFRVQIPVATSGFSRTEQRNELMSLHGTSRHFAATQQFGRFWSEADIQRAALT